MADHGERYEEYDSAPYFALDDTVGSARAVVGCLTVCHEDDESV